MTTPRQQLLARLEIALSANAARRALYPNGRRMEFCGELITVQYPPIKPGSSKMNDLVEGLAKGLGDDVWEYYLGANDGAYDRLVREAVRNA